MKDFWEMFKELCLDNGVTPSYVLTQMKMPRGYATRWKQGIEPNDLSKKKIADYFDVPFTYFEDGKKTPKAPVFSSVAAGVPIDGDPIIDDWQELTPEMVRQGGSLWLRVHGESMYPELQDGDLILIRQQEEAEEGKVCVFRIGTEYTVKRLHRVDGGIILQATNEEFDSKFYTDKQVKSLPVEIFGIAVALVREKL